MSAPALIVIPTLVLVRAGASLIPVSNHCNFSLIHKFSYHTFFSIRKNTCYYPHQLPACAPIAFVVLSLSPVSMTTLIPISFKSLIAAGLSSFIISATAIIPHTLSSCIKRSGVFPSSASFSALLPNSSDTSACSLINLKLPPVILFPLYDAVRPFPGSTLKSSKASAFIFLHSASLTIAFANGCSLFISREYASLNKVSLSYSLIGIISVTLGSPFVIVPVLSSATIFILPAFFN